MKRGEIYKVKGFNHYCVLLQDEPDEEYRIDAIILTHSKKGGALLKNSALMRECLEEFDENGRRYPFQWEETQMVNCIFSKDTELIICLENNLPVGKVKEECLPKMERRVTCKIKWDKHIRFLTEEEFNRQIALAEIK